jgi:ABC-type Mn2+/Zn2+ transport system ATPase subunit
MREGKYPMGGQIIQFRDVTLGYGNHTVLWHLTFSVQDGDFLGIVGPNGCGKTTILRAMLGTLRPKGGKIIRSRPSNREELTFGYIPQYSEVDQIFPLTVQDIVLMGRYKRIGPMRKPGPRDREVVMESLRHAAITDLESRQFSTLSEGQKQRTLIARALAAEPSVLMLDEPTSAMDLVSERDIMTLIQSLHEEEKLTTVMVTHNLSLMANCAKTIAIIGKETFLIGAAAEVLTDENLSQLYNTEVIVQEVLGKRIIIPGDGP